MIIILAVLAAIRASPVELRSPSVVSLDQLQAPGPSCQCDDPHGCRSLGDIIRSCVLTILLCTWVSMHPNIPGPDERWPRIAVRRVGLMLLALIVPEATVSWALRQRGLAVNLANKHKGEGWTLTHGFFASMGGFMEYKGNRPIGVLLPDQLQSYSLTGNGDFPRLSKAEIEDRSKGDAISKGFVILQTGWFVTQCIARGAQGLPITELELVTVAFAALNLVMYVLWWDKPQNVQRGVRVYKKRITEEPIDDGDVEATVGFWSALGDALSNLPAVIVRGPYVEDFHSWQLRVLFWPIYKPLMTLIGYDDDSEGEYEMRVQTFYPTEWVNASKSFSAVLVASTTLAFGSVHCIGWLFTFPSAIERILWRVTSVSITGVPIASILVAYIVEYARLSRSFGWAIIISLLSLYVLGRLVLLVLPFVSLRSLPLAAFHIVHWTSFIPHI